ncbi:MAG: Mu-like prophage major head subunit gpT family protein [Elusimicrobiales bacterium]
MLINAQSVEAIFKTFNTLYQKAFQEYKPLFRSIATEVPSTAREENYSFLGAVPRMRKWLGDRQYKNLLACKYAVLNEDFESTVELKRNDIADDRIGLFSPVVSEMGRAAASHPDELVFALLAAGFDELCYDGKPFFSATHKVNKADVSNMDVPQSNPGNPWFLLDTTRAIKPLVFQNREAPEFTAMTQPSSEHVFKQNTFLYGVNARDNAGYGLWQFAFGSKQPLTPANYAKARAAMMAFADVAGRKMQVKPNLLVVGGSNEGAARKIAYGENSATETGMESNPWKGTVEVMCVPYLD